MRVLSFSKAPLYCVFGACRHRGEWCTRDANLERGVQPSKITYPLIPLFALSPLPFLQMAAAQRLPFARKNNLIPAQPQALLNYTAAGTCSSEKKMHPCRVNVKILQVSSSPHPIFSSSPKKVGGLYSVPRCFPDVQNIPDRSAKHKGPLESRFLRIQT